MVVRNRQGIYTAIWKCPITCHSREQVSPSSTGNGIYTVPYTSLYKKARRLFNGTPSQLQDLQGKNQSLLRRVPLKNEVQLTL